MVDNDRLANLMRNADPAHSIGGSPMAPQHRALLERITAEPNAVDQRDTATRGLTPPIRRRWNFSLVSSAAVALVALVFIVLAVVIPTTGASAQTPPTIKFQPTDLTTQEVKDLILKKLDEGTGPLLPERSATYTGWYFQRDETTGGTRTLISPQVTTLEWNADRSGRLTVVAGKSYFADDKTAWANKSDGFRAGTVLSDQRFAVGEYSGPLSVDSPGDTPEQLRRSLASYGAPADAGAYVTAEGISTLMTMWTFTNAQQKSLLTILLDCEDVQISGITTDRSGREIIGIAGDNTDGNRNIVLVSTSTGRIVGLETVRTTRWEDIPAGATTAYTIWENTP